MTRIYYSWLDSALAMKMGVVDGLRERKVVDFRKYDNNPLLSGGIILTK